MEEIRNIKLIVSIILILSCTSLFGQQVPKQVDLILIINDKVITSGISNPHIYLFKNERDSTDVTFSYQPGRVTFFNPMFDQLLNEAVRVIIRMDYYDYVNKKQNLHNYELSVDKKWLKESYLIVSIFDLNKKQYQRLSPIKNGRDYTFSISSPNYNVGVVKQNE